MRNPHTQAGILEFIKQFGSDPISSACLQPDLSYLSCSFGIQAYKKFGNTAISLGPPICAPENQKELMQRFMQMNKKTLFCYIKEAQLKHLDQSATHHCGMGIDRYVDHETLQQKTPKRVSGALKHASKSELKLLEYNPSSLSTSERDEISSIQQAYLNNFLYKKEITFINTPLSLNLEQDPRRFFHIRSGNKQEVLGFIVLNPYFKEAKTKGYLLDIIRFKKSKVWGVWLSCVAKLSSLLAEEGHELCLGYCPLYEIDHSFDNSRVLSWQVATISKQLSKARYPQRLYQLKKQIPGFSKQRYFSSTSRNGLSALHTLIRASGVSLPSMIFGSSSQ